MRDRCASHCGQVRRVSVQDTDECLAGPVLLRGMYPVSMDTEIGIACPSVHIVCVYVCACVYTLMHMHSLQKPQWDGCGVSEEMRTQVKAG